MRCMAKKTAAAIKKVNEKKVSSVATAVSGIEDWSEISSKSICGIAD
jgi:hypothetical protein